MPRPDWIDDQASIPDETVLWRGVADPDEIRVKGGNEVPSVGSLVTQELSVSVGAETNRDAFLAKGLARNATWWIWTFTAGAARAAGCIVDRDPKPDDPSHCVVLRADTPGARLRESSAKRLIGAGAWLPENQSAPVGPPGGA